MSSSNFADRLIDRMKQTKSRVIVGLDPQREHAPASLLRAGVGAMGFGHRHVGEARQWGVREYCENIIEATKDIVAGYKFQLAFFERFGANGFEILERLMYEHEDQNFILDGKRGDVANTAKGIAEAYFFDQGRDDQAPLLCDAITLNGYLGMDTIEPYAPYLKSQHGIFVLCKTSNPGAGDFQDLKVEDGRPVYLHLAEKVNAYAEEFVGDSGYSALGLVVGATYPESARQIREVAPRCMFLVPGIGVQGGKPQDAAAFCNKDGGGAVFNFSRSISYAYKFGPFADEHSESDYAKAARIAAEHYRVALNDTLGEPA
jgi:orotidine-5'-phosphate decarboxylase